MAATLDSSLTHIYSDMHQLAGKLVDILLRLEDRLDVLAERASGDVVQQEPPADQKNRDSTRSDSDSWLGVLPSSKEGTQGSAGRRSGLDGLKRSKSRQNSRQEATPGAIPLRESEGVQLQGAAPGKCNSGERKIKKLAARSFSLATGSPKWMQDGRGEDPAGSAKLPPSAGVTDMLSEFKLLNKKIGSMDKKIDLMAISMRVRGVNSEFDYEEDRKRLKEKLKQAIEADRRSRVRTIVSRAEVWLEYVFGICQADQRLGKRGSR